MNRQRTVRIPMRELRRFSGRTRRLLRLPPESVTICLVTEAEIAKWNRAYRRKSGPTDVLSFPADARRARAAGFRTPYSIRETTTRRSSDLFGEQGLPGFYLGDIAIAPAVARRNARRFGRTFSQEMRILMLHGMLHLLGYDHETDTGQMDRRERQLRRQLGLA